jgi:glycosyltransferase involved in cell wall biosynthesis
MSIKQVSTQDIQTQPLISFIITTYNLTIPLLQKCISSVLQLSLSKQDREIIIVDDGSDISPINDMLDYRDEIIYLRQKNQGLSVARNTGLNVASGTYIQFIDGDDYIIQPPYEHCLDIVRYHTPDIVLFYGTHHEKSEIPFTFEGPLTGTEYMNNHNLRASAWGYIFKKQILLDLRFTPNTLHEDEEFTPQLMLRAEQVYFTNANAYYYRERKTSIMHNNSVQHKQKRLEDIERILCHLQEIATTLPEFDRVALNRRIAQLTMDYLYNVIKLTKSHKCLNESIERLRQHALYPLPNKKYTKSYTTFRKLIDNKIGRELLFLGLTHIK